MTAVRGGPSETADLCAIVAQLQRAITALARESVEEGR